MTEHLFHFVRHESATDWLRVGWVARRSLHGSHHGEWSVLMEWLCSCAPVMPVRT